MVVNKRKQLVLDASVILKWFLTEDERWVDLAFDIAKDYKDKRFDIIVPTHCFVEISNTFSRKIPEWTLRHLSDLQTMEIREHHLSLEITFYVLSLLRKYKKISFYDAFYHAIAIEKGIMFITADEKYYNLVHREGNILLLKDYALSKI